MIFIMIILIKTQINEFCTQACEYTMQSAKALEAHAATEKHNARSNNETDYCREGGMMYCSLPRALPTMSRKGAPFYP